MDSNDITKAYEAGKQLAYEGREKSAFLSSVLKGGKFLFTGGHLGKPGSLISKLSPHHIGAPLGGGALGAYFAEDGEKSKGFIKGFAGGLLFNAAMPLGSSIGKRILAPGFSGAGSAKIMKGIGFSDEATAAMKSSQNINKALNTRQGVFRGVTERALSSGNFKGSTKLTQSIDDILKNQSKMLPDAVKTKLTNLQSQLSAGLSPTNQKKFLEELQDVSSTLYRTGYATGTKGQQFALKGTRFAKGVGMMGGGMGLGMALTGPMERSLDSTPSSYFNSTGGH